MHASNEARRQDGESVKSECVFVCGIITGLMVMTKTHEREKDACVCVCVCVKHCTCPH